MIHDLKAAMLRCQDMGITSISGMAQHLGKSRCCIRMNGAKFGITFERGKCGGNHRPPQKANENSVQLSESMRRVIADSKSILAAQVTTYDRNHPMFAKVAAEVMQGRRA